LSKGVPLFIEQTFIHCEERVSLFRAETAVMPTSSVAAAPSTLCAPTAPQPEVKVLFCDLDGTLVHYPKDFQEYASLISEDEATGTAIVRYSSGEERACQVLSSMTGGKAYISTATLELVGRLRSLGVLFVIITGARASTYAQRRPRLPPADFEFFENGGRMLDDGALVPEWTDGFEAQVGYIADRTALVAAHLPPPELRQGSLWELYRKMTRDGWIVDARDYTTNFRVDVSKTKGKTSNDFQGAIEGELDVRGLKTSFNLGKADIYPMDSGKAKAATHVLDLKGWNPDNAVAMFDDDNDIELGSLVGRSYLPGVTHQSVLDAMKAHEGRWTLTSTRGFLGTEEALSSILDICQRQRQPATLSNTCNAQM
jgi:hydroxymethylpyrimidine pyrophosphatase-like HAD family hydrolase